MGCPTNDPYADKVVFFDGQVRAPWASDEYGPEERRKLDRLLAALAPLRGLRVLEPGCGTGRLTEVLAREVGPEGRVVAMDISPAMVAAACRRVTGYRNVELSLGAVETLSGYDRDFDLILCHQVFPHFVDPAQALTGLAGVLKINGRLVISHFISSAQINAVHCKAGTAVAGDVMPPPKTLARWCRNCDLLIDGWRDDEEGYLLTARRF